MKARVLLLLMLICLPVIYAVVPTASADQSQLVITDFQRNADLQQYGMLIITDTITVFNPTTSPAFHLLVAYPLSAIESVKEFHVETVDENSLFFQRVPLIGPNCTGWRIFLPEPLMPDHNVSFVASMALAGLTVQDTLTASVTFSPFPTSPYFIKSFSTTFTHHRAVTSPTQDLWTGTNIHPYYFEERTVILNHASSSFLPVITYLELKRVLSLDGWGYIFAHEVHTFRVDSPNPLFSSTPNRRWTDISVTLPPGSEFLRVFDSVSNLTSQIATPTNATHPGTLRVGLQYHLQEGDVYQFFVEYRIPLDYHQQVLQTGLFFHFNLFSGDPWFIQNQVTEFHLPIGSWLQGIPTDSQVTISPTGQYLVRFHNSNVTSLHQAEIAFYYVYPIQPVLARPTLLFLVIGIMCLAYAAFRRTPIFREEEDIISPLAEIDTAVLGEFCSLYGEKIAILLQTERLEQSMLQGKISKPRYRKEKKNFERKLRTLNTELSTRTQALIDAGGKYESNCRQLEILEAERVSAIEALHALEQRYRQKRITAAAYQKLSKDIEKRRDRAVSRMDRILLSLREDLSK
ncbi:MAG: hypothetical protein ACFE89_07975 [Candidatus Hodarchaeota archaeon]